MREKPLVGFFALHYDPPIGGAEKSMHNYFEKLSSFYDIRVFCFLNQDGRAFTNRQTTVRDGVQITHSAHNLQKEINDFCYAQKPDLVGSMLMGSDAILNFAKIHSVPTFFFVHGFFEDICQHYILNSCPHSDLATCDFGSHCRNAQDLIRHKNKYQMADSIVCNSEYTRDILHRFFPETKEKTHLVYPNFRPSMFFNPTEDYKRDRRSVLAVNSMPTKGSAIVKNVAALNPDITFHYVDVKDSERSEFEKFPNIKIYGRLSSEEMVDMYSKVGCVLCPTFMQETFSGVVCESILSGTPVVAMKRGNIPNLIKHEENGFILDTIDIHEWSKTLLMALNMKVDFSYSKKMYARIDEISNMFKIKEIFDDLMGIKDSSGNESIENRDSIENITRAQRQEIIKRIFQ